MKCSGATLAVSDTLYRQRYHSLEGYTVSKRVCQNAHFGFTLEGASEWLRCKALRMRVQGVY